MKNKTKYNSKYLEEFDAMVKKENSTVKIDPDLRDKLKIKAIEQNTTLGKLIDSILRKSLMILCLLMVIGCASKKLVPTDPVNYKRFQHSQKIRVGMTHREVLDAFGSPTVAKEYSWAGKPAVQWIWTRSIHCATWDCYAYFDLSGRVFHSSGFRLEFDNNVVNVDD